MPETKHLLDVLKQVENTRPLLARADEVLEAWQHEELIAGLLKTPQSPPYHTEGPTVRAHLRLMLASLFAITDGAVQLTDIEEFARLKGLEDEILEMQETINENAASLEVFCLVHDIGKQFKMFRDAKGVHYHGHEKEIYRPEVLALLGRLAKEFRLEDRDVDMLVPLVSYHLASQRFQKAADPKQVNVLTKFATDQGVDADDFINLLQSAILLDQILGSRPGDPTPLINFLLAEREYAPWKLKEKEAARALERKRLIHKILVDVGLDGHGIMQLTGLTPGRELGDLVKKSSRAMEVEDRLETSFGVWQEELTRRILLGRERLGKALNR